MSVREQPTKVKMAIGIDNFREMREKQNYYVDKTKSRIIMWTRRG